MPEWRFQVGVDGVSLCGFQVSSLLSSLFLLLYQRCSFMLFCSEVRVLY